MKNVTDHGLGFSVEEIGPDDAKRYLELNVDNFRPPTKQRVGLYAQSMLDGDWQLGGCFLIFDTDGHLVNGQHTCLAVIQSGVTITVIVVRGVKKESAITMDRAKERRVRDWMGHLQVPNHSLVGNMAGWIWRLKHGRFLSNGGGTTSTPGTTMPLEEVLVEYEENKPFLLQTMEWIKSKEGEWTPKEAIPAAVTTAFEWACAKQNAVLAHEFHILLRTGRFEEQIMDDNNPVQVLRTALERDQDMAKKGRPHVNQNQKRKWLIKAWAMFSKKEVCTSLGKLVQDDLRVLDACKIVDL